MKHFLIFLAVLLLVSNVAAYTVVQDSIKTNTTWTSGNTYLISGRNNIDGNLSVLENATLTIQPNVVVKISDKNYLAIEDGGILVAQGTAAQNIVITSCSDQTKGEDTSSEVNCGGSPATADYSRGIQYGFTAGKPTADSNNLRDINFSFSDRALILTGFDLNSIERISFHNNDGDASSGGAITIDSSSGLHYIKNCFFTENGTLAGNNVIMLSGFVEEIRDNNFFKNNSGDGTLRSNGIVNSISFNYFYGNFSITGGGIVAANGADFNSINDNNFISNSSIPLQGGAIHASSESDINYIYNNIFKDNSGVTGGGAIWSDGDINSIYNNLFKDNNAGTGAAGGAIGTGLSKIGLIFNNTFVDNNASIGGAIGTAGSNIDFLFNNIFAYHETAIEKNTGSFVNIGNNAYWENDVNCSNTACGLTDVNFTEDPFHFDGTDRNFLINSSQLSVVQDSGLLITDNSFYSTKTVRADNFLDSLPVDIGYHYDVNGIFNRSTDVNILGDHNGDCSNNACLIKGGTDHNVWFAVSDTDTNASDFLVDFNICVSPALGSGCGGETLFNDLNLSMDFKGVNDFNDLGQGFDINFYWEHTANSLDANRYACINLKDTRYDLNYGYCSSLSFLIDSTIPIVLANDSNNLWQNTDANLQFKCTDSGTGCGKFFYSLDDTNYEVNWGHDGNIGIVLTTDLNHEVFFISNDLVDNNSITGLLYLGIDKTIPVSDHNAFNAGTAWFSQDLNINITCTDVLAGCKNLYYGIVGDANYQILWGYDLNIGIPVTADGNTEIFYWVDDNTFGIGDNNTASIYLNIGKDSVQPSVSWDGNSFWNRLDRIATVTLSGHDGAGSGIKRIWYKEDVDWQGTIGSEVFATDINFVEYLAPIDINIDGNFALWFFAEDNVDLNGDVNVQHVLINSVVPSIIIKQPDINTSQSGTTWTFTFTVSDSNDVSYCDYNASSSGVPIAGQQSKTITAVAGICTISFNLFPAIGDIIDVNIYARDLNAQRSSVIVSNFIAYLPTSAPLSPQPTGDGGGGRHGDIGDFCLLDSQCLSDLICYNFICIRPDIDFNAVVVYPHNITPSPFQSILPNTKLVFQDIVVSNQKDKAYDIEIYFDCTGEEFCAKDWCSIEGETEFTLQPRGAKLIKAFCIVDSEAEIGSTYFTQLIVKDADSSAMQGVSVVIPIRTSQSQFLFSGISSASDFFKAVSEYGLICLTSNVGGCLFEPLSDTPIDLGFVELRYINLFLALTLFFSLISLVSLFTVSLKPFVKWFLLVAFFMFLFFVAGGMLFGFS